jgi:hypothetical protein
MAKNDDMIKQLMAKVASQKESLGAKPKVSWKTNGVFKFNDKDYFNLNTVSNVEQLVGALAHMLGNQRLLNDAGNRLGVVVADASYGGYTVHEWEEDFKLRIAVLKWDEKKKQLEETEKKLSMLVSEEARTEMELEKIAKSLG